MTDKKISELNELSAKPADDDEIPIVDKSVPETKKLAWSNVKIDADKVELEEVGTATYDDVQDWANNTQSAGVISGGGFTDNNDGTMTVAAGTGFIKATDSVIGTTKFFDWSENASVTPADNDLSFVYVESDGSISTTTDYSSINDHTQVSLGRVYREGTELHFLESSQRVYDLMHRVRRRFYQTERSGERADGMSTTRKDGGSKNLCLDITASKFFWGLDMFETSAFDSSGADTFSTWYNDGSWQETTGVSEIDNQQYNDYGVGLANLSNNKYGVHWVFMHEDGHVHVVYGVGDYDLRDSYLATVPANLPAKVWKMGILIAKIVIEEDEEDSFTEIFYPWTTTFAGSVVTDHGSLGGLGDDDHPQYKKAIPRIWSAASDATPDINSDDYDAVTITALAAAITDVNMSGTPTNFQKLLFRIKDDGTTRNITWGADFQDGSVELPTETTASKTLLVGVIYDSVDSKWTCEASGSRA